MKEATPTEATRRARRAVEGESDCVLGRHGRRGWSQGGRMLGRDARRQGRKTAGGRCIYIYINVYTCIYT